MSDPGTVLDGIHKDAEDLDRISKRLYQVTENVIEAEEAWDVLYDQVSEALLEEYREAGRKSDPAEHTLIAATRRAHRSQWTRLQRSKRELARLENQLRAKTAAMNGRQSELKALRGEAAAQDLPQPQWSRSAA